MRNEGVPLSRHRRVGKVWSWLPAFRAVAEYESIQRAALALSVSPSSLSRTIKLLEASLGFAVFTRSTAGTLLTPSGAQLLEATRDAMRRVDEALPAMPTRLTVGLESSLLAAPVARSVTQLTALVGCPVSLCTSPGGQLGERLRRGELDFAVCTSVLEAGNGLQVTLVAEMPWVVVGARDDAMVALENHFGAKNAKCVASSLESAIVLAAGLKLGLLVPQAFAPPSMPVQRRLPQLFRVTVARRTAVVPNQSAHLEHLTAALRTALG